MNEEEIIKFIKDEIRDCKNIENLYPNKDNIEWKEVEEYQNVLQGLLDLYKQEKEKNKELEKHYKHEQEYINGEVFSAKQMHLIDEDYISKDKIKERMEQTKKVYDEEMKPYMIEVGNGEKVLNVTYLSKKEKEELINKRNCLLVQIKIYEMLLEDK